MAQVSAVDRDPTVVVPVMVHHLQSADGWGFEVAGGVVEQQQRLCWGLVPVWCGSALGSRWCQELSQGGALGLDRVVWCRVEAGGDAFPGCGGRCRLGSCVKWILLSSPSVEDCLRNAC